MWSNPLEAADRLGARLAPRADRPADDPLADLEARLVPYPAPPEFRRAQWLAAAGALLLLVAALILALLPSSDGVRASTFYWVGHRLLADTVAGLGPFATPAAIGAGALFGVVAVIALLNRQTPVTLGLLLAPTVLGVAALGVAGLGWVVVLIVVLANLLIWLIPLVWSAASASQGSFGTALIVFFGGYLLLGTLSEGNRLEPAGAESRPPPVVASAPDAPPTLSPVAPPVRLADLRGTWSGRFRATTDRGRMQLTVERLALGVVSARYRYRSGPCRGTLTLLKRRGQRLEFSSRETGDPAGCYGRQRYIVALRHADRLSVTTAYSGVEATLSRGTRRP